MDSVKTTIINAVKRALIRKFETSPSTTAGITAVAAGLVVESPLGLVSDTGVEWLDMAIRVVTIIAGLYATFTSAKESYEL